DIDPFQTVQGWWNTDDNDYEAPSEHLFEMLNIESTDQNGKYEFGDGDVYIVRQDPKEFVLEEDNDTGYVDIVREMYEAAGSETLNFKNSLYLERGPYDIVAVMDESINDEPFVVDEPVIDLFDSELPVLSQRAVQPGEQVLLFNLGRIENRDKPQVLATAARVSEEETGSSSYSFVAKSPANTTNSMRILLPEEPEEAELTLKGQEISDFEQSWDGGSNTCFLSFENSPDGVRVELKW
ncbi:MAG: hypothetical protein R6U46_04490, partial [Marinilabilia sp.]